MQNGFNPLRWDCSKSGCFNKSRRPKIEVFHDALPGRISFGDVDGIVEIEGNALVLEWKGKGARIGKGQEIMWTRLTRSGVFTVLVIEGDAETMEVFSTRTFFQGKLHDAESADLDAVKAKISSWVSYAKANSQLVANQPPDIRLRIYRDGNKPIDISGFTTVEQAIAAGNEWQGRLWWRVAQDGKIVTEEPMRTKR